MAPLPTLTVQGQNRVYTTPEGTSQTFTGAITDAERLFAGGSATQTPAPQTTTTSPFMQAATSALTAASGMISSSDNNLASTLAQIRGDLQKASEASAARIESEAARARDEILEDSEQTRKDILARQRGTGFFSNLKVAEEFDKGVQKKINELEARKNEALLTNDSNLYNKLVDLQLKEIEMSQQTRQQAIQNYFALSSSSLQFAGVEADERKLALEEQRYAFSVLQEEQQKIQSVLGGSARAMEALTKAGKSIEDFNSVAEAMAFVSPYLAEEERARIANIYAQIERANNETVRSIEDNARSAVLAYAEAKKQAGSNLTDQEYRELYTRYGFKDERTFFSWFGGYLAPDSDIRSWENIYRLQEMSPER